MTQSITDHQLHKLLDEVHRADTEYEQSVAAYEAASKAKEAAAQIRSKAHNAARPHLWAIKGPVVYDERIWKMVSMHVSHERVGRDLSPRQESLLPEANKASA